MKRNKVRLTSQLPATPCTPEMREQVERIASEGGVSIAAAQRVILALFLRDSDSKTIIHANNLNSNEERSA